MKNRIKEYLTELEKEKDIRILLAVESGSRAWGFASENSDWDVRVIYVPNNKDYWISLYPDFEQTFDRSVKEEDLDVHGWVLSKALRLLHKGNSAIHEWVHSPIVYKKNTAFYARMGVLSRTYFNPLPMMWHYVELASGNYHRYIEDKGEYKLKRLLYVWRALMVAKYIDHFNEFPGTAINSLIKNSVELGVPANIQTQVNKLLTMKRSGYEMGIGTWDEYSDLLEWLAASIKELKDYLKAGNVKAVLRGPDPLNKTFRQFI